METSPTTEDKKKINAKDELISNIKEWVKLDNELTKMKNDIKIKTGKKKVLTDKLISIMKSNNIDCFDMSKGALIHKQRKIPRQISGKYLLSQLELYYKEQPEVAKEITKQVLDNRPKFIKDELKIKS